MRLYIKFFLYFFCAKTIYTFFPYYTIILIVSKYILIKISFFFKKSNLIFLFVTKLPEFVFGAFGTVTVECDHYLARLAFYIQVYVLSVLCIDHEVLQCTDIIFVKFVILLSVFNVMLKRCVVCIFIVLLTRLFYWQKNSLCILSLMFTHLPANFNIRSWTPLHNVV